ncbi:MAG: DUF4846 domain-containing protein [Planctomycetes bacterium]|nr:DUF4846 domain-containing protein [Planctomycetota bacterium]
MRILLLLAAYPWLATPDKAQSIERRIPPPEGHDRVAADGFGAWLRGLPLKPGRPEVLLHDGRPKRNQRAHFAVADLDTGKGDLQQCADCVIRLRAEYLWERREPIAFRFTSGDVCEWSRWAEGWRPVVSGSRVSWKKGGSGGDGYPEFRRYLRTVFQYAGTLSLERETEAASGAIEPGDMFLRGGSPGHVVLVLDVAAKDGRRVFLLGQGYMPAQDFHVLVNPSDPRLSPWYAEGFGEELKTPEWTFRRGERRRFRASR